MLQGICHMKLVILIGLLATSSPEQNHADFEGALDVRFRIDDESGTKALLISSAGVRHQIGTDWWQLVKSSNPDLMYSVHDDTKTYREKRPKPARADGSSKNTTVENLGVEAVLGRECTHVRIGTSEYWIRTDIHFDPTTKRILKAYSWLPDVVGLPDGLVVREKHDEMTLAIRVDERKLPTSLFQVPADYKKCADGFCVLSSARQRDLRSQIESASPKNADLLRELLDDD
jgi:hypothetical protein